MQILFAPNETNELIGYYYKLKFKPFRMGASSCHIKKCRLYLRSKYFKYHWNEFRRNKIPVLHNTVVDKSIFHRGQNCKKKFSNIIKLEECIPPSVRSVARHFEDTNVLLCILKMNFFGTPCTCIPYLFYLGNHVWNPSVSAEQSHESLFWSSHPDQRAPPQVRLLRNYLE